MSEPAKDEPELVERVALALHYEVDGGQSAWMDVSKFERSCREMEADAAIRAIRAAGWAVLPLRLMEELTPAEADTLRVENARLREALIDLLDNAPVQALRAGEGCDGPAANGELLADQHYRIHCACAKGEMAGP